MHGDDKTFPVIAKFIYNLDHVLAGQWFTYVCLLINKTQNTTFIENLYHKQALKIKIWSELVRESIIHAHDRRSKLRPNMRV